jgi:hypothetical protein
MVGMEVTPETIELRSVRGFVVFDLPGAGLYWRNEARAGCDRR